MDSLYGTGNVYCFYPFYIIGYILALIYQQKVIFPKLLNVDKFFDRRGWQWLLCLGKYAIGVYCSHFVFLPLVPRMGLNNLFNYPVVNAIVSTSFVIISSLLLSFMIEKNKYTRLVLMGKK